MAKDELSQLLQDVLHAEEHDLLDSDIGQAVRRIISANVADDFVRGWLRETVHQDKVAQAFRGPFQIPNLRHGEIILGIAV